MWRLKPELWPCYPRYLRQRWRRSGPVLHGIVYIGRGVRLLAKRHYGRLVLGKAVRIGDYSALRAHEGSLVIGDAAVLGNRVTVNCYLDVFIGRRTLIADDVYIIDFDHRIAELDEAIMDQGIIKAPVRIGSGCWLGTKAVVTRGVTIGDGAVVGAGAIVTRDVPDNAIVAGVPARVIGDRAAIGGDLSGLRKPYLGAQTVIGGVLQRDVTLMGIH